MLGVNSGVHFQRSFRGKMSVCGRFSWEERVRSVVFVCCLEKKIQEEEESSLVKCALFYI